MFRNGLIFFLPLLFFSACISQAPAPLEAPAPPPLEDSFPLDEKIVFTGVSGIFSKREDSIQNALEDAARRFAFFRSVGAEIIENEYSGGGAFDYSHDDQGKLLYDTDLTKYIEALQFDPDTDVFEENRTIFVHTHYTAPHKLPIGPGHTFKKERPRWVDDPPNRIAGFLTGVGYAVPQSAHKDTIIRSYENAVYAIIRTLSSELHSKQETRENNAGAFDFYAATEQTVVSRGTLTGFYILESWTDPATRAVWTLAVALPG